MTEIQPFTFPITGESVRTLLVDDSPWFVASDVCAVLGHSNTSMALAMVDEDDRWTLRRSDTLSFAYPFGDLRVQAVSLVNESGLYALILRSNVAGAREFKRWVTSEVLPSIRKTGSYSLPVPMDELELAERAVQLIKEKRVALARAEEAENRAASAEHQMLEMAPAARAFDTFLSAVGDYDAAESAKFLCRDKSINTGQRRLLLYMDSIGWTYKHGKQPRCAYQRQVDLGRLVMKPTAYKHHETGTEMAGDEQVRITVKGLFELHKLLGGTGDLRALVEQELAA